ncbi:MAG TPA: pyridoxal-dependent decarboxylase [Nocardioidaceae bacterium]|nr:pyridoxal-dependent decarboxylase [Nocardioidaceae bacterium]
MLSAAVPRADDDTGHDAVAAHFDPTRAPTSARTPAPAGRWGADLATSDVPTLAAYLVRALTAMQEAAAGRGGPVPAGAPGAVHDRVAEALAGEPIPERGVGAGHAIDALCGLAGWGAADPGDPRCAGHLHTPPLAMAVAADTVAAALNQSLDSWDQAPAMTGLEAEVVGALGALVYGSDDASDEPAGVTSGVVTSGVVTSGGTESNLMGLLLARSAVCRRAWGVDVVRTGLPAQADRLRVYCSEAAHFSTQRAAGLLGLGEERVVPVAVDAEHRLRPEALDRAMRRQGDTYPLAVVATAGTTDAGAVDPLPAIAAVAREHGCWLHVDAAYGGGALFSRRLRPLLTGIRLADSVALDLHKLGWQPTAAGVFLARGAAALAPLARQVAYLNPGDDEEAGYTSLLGRSLRTTRRPDVLKIAVTLRALGRQGLGAMVDHCRDLATHAAACVDADRRLERTLPVTLTSVVFRYAAAQDADTVNARIRRDLLAAGRAVVGRCDVAGRVWLKLTLLNPEATAADVEALLDLVAATGARLEEESA